jgi:hypothetical protein
MVPSSIGGKLISAVFLTLAVFIVSLPVPFIEGKLLHQQHLQLTEDRLEMRLKRILKTKQCHRGSNRTRRGTASNIHAATT